MRFITGIILYVLGFAPSTVSSLKITKTRYAVSSQTSAPTVGDPLIIDKGALDPNRVISIPSPVTTHGNLATTGAFTVTIENKATLLYSILYQSNAGAPAPVGGIATTGALPPSATTVVLFPTGWAGALVIGESLNINGSRFEGSFDAPVGKPIPAYDISYVDGYSAPIVCGCNGAVVTGCNIPLFQRSTCGHLSTDRTVCLNPARFTNDGPAAPFFAACQGAAFTFPNDTGANTDCAFHSITCCIGPECPADPKQPA